MLGYINFKMIGIQMEPDFDENDKLKEVDTANTKGDRKAWIQQDRTQTGSIMQPQRTSSPRKELMMSVSSSGSTDWSTIMEEDDRRLRMVRRDLEGYKKRVFRLSNSGQDDPPPQIETDEVVLVRRQKQIEYGMNTCSYAKYIEQIPKRKRTRGKHPVTPNKFQVCSRRSWEAQVRLWKRNLHLWESTGSTLERKAVTKRMLSTETWSDSSSENDHQMDLEESSLDTSVTSTTSSGFTNSHEGSRSASPLTILENNCKPEGTGLDKPLNKNMPYSYAAVAASSNMFKPSLHLYIPTTNPKTPTATPTEGQVILDPQLSPDPFDASELVAALKKVSTPNSTDVKKKGRNLTAEFSCYTKSNIPSSANESKDEDMGEFQVCWD